MRQLGLPDNSSRSYSRSRFIGCLTCCFGHFNHGRLVRCLLSNPRMRRTTAAWSARYMSINQRSEALYTPVATVARSVERRHARSGVRVLKVWLGAFLEVCVDRCTNHSAHTAKFPGALLLVRTVTQGIHLVLVNLKGIPGNDPLTVRAFGRSGVGSFGYADVRAFGLL